MFEKQGGIRLAQREIDFGIGPLERVSEVLAKEVKGFGIKVTAIAPGSFRTDWAGRSMVRVGRSIPD
jgi:hypothetical protein